MALLGGAFGKAAAVGVIAAGLSVAPADAMIDSRDKIEQQKPGAMDVMMDRLMGGLNYEMRGPSTPTNTIVMDARQQTPGAPNAKGAFNTAVVASPQLGQLVADVTTALDSKPGDKLRADAPPVPTANVARIDQNTADRAVVADRANKAINTLQAAAQNKGKLSPVAGLAATSFMAAAATSMGVPRPVVAAVQTALDATQLVAANGAGTMTGLTGNSLSQSFNAGERGAPMQMTSGYTTSVFAPSPAQQAQASKPVEIAGREDLYGRATLAGDGLTGIESLKIDGKGMDALQRNVGAMTRDVRQTRQTMDRIAADGFKTTIGEAAAQIGSGSVSLRQIDPLLAVNAVTIRPLAPRPGTGMGGGFA